MRKLVLLFLAFFLIAGTKAQAFSLDLGQNITIKDGNYSSTNTWYSAHEDQEVEPGMVANQYWDMEAFFYDSRNGMLTVMAGYDLVNGYQGMMPGDIFIDVNGDAQFGDYDYGVQGNEIKANTFGYDYVLDLNLSLVDNEFTFDVFDITGQGVTTLTTYYPQNAGSNPWRYNDGGTKIDEGSGYYISGLSDASSGMLGGFHNAMRFDLRFLGDLNIASFNVHNTMQCGNDDLEGQFGAPVPEPATLLLLGSGMIGLAGLSRRKMFKRA